MIASSIVDGFRSAIRRPGLVALLWAWNLLVGLAAAIPAYFWWSAASRFTPGTDSMRDRFDPAVVADLTKYDSASGFGLISGAAIGAVLVSFVAGALVNGGILEVLAAEGDDRRLMHRFFRGAGHFGGRFLRLLVPTCLVGLIVSGILTFIAGFATSPLADSEWEPGAMLAGLINLTVFALTWGWFLIGQDYARIRIAADDRPRVLRAWFDSLVFVLRKLLSTAAIGASMAVVSVALLAAWLLYDGNASSATWGGILALIAVQQAVVASRTGVRVAMLGAERSYLLRTAARAAAAQARPDLDTRASESDIAAAVIDAPAGETRPT